MSKIDNTYHELLKKIKKQGFKYEDPNRKDIYRIQIPHAQIEHNFVDGFPAITTKKLYWKGIVGELLWFLRSDTNIKYLVDNNINIWNKDAYNYYLKNGEKPIKGLSLNEFKYNIEKSKNPPLGNLGRVYGAQWRDWKGSNKLITVDNFSEFRGINYIDQIFNLIKGLKKNPMGTQHIVTAWNPAELDDMALPPCHWSFEILVEPLSEIERIRSFKDFSIIENRKLQRACEPPYTKLPDDYREDILNTWNIPKYQFTLKWHQRSVDTFLGLPFNIASYALLAHIIGKMTNMIPKGIIGDLSNVHIYEPHMDAVDEQLSRSTNFINSRCDLEIDTLTEVQLERGLKYIDNNEICIDNFKLSAHMEQSAIKAEMLPYNK